MFKYSHFLGVIDVFIHRVVSPSDVQLLYAILSLSYREQLYHLITCLYLCFASAELWAHASMVATQLVVRAEPLFAKLNTSLWRIPYHIDCMPGLLSLRRRLKLRGRTTR